MCVVCSKHSDRTGITLVEVVAGLALLATLLVSLLVSYRAHAAQIRSAQTRLEAMRIADRLLAAWTANDALPPAGAGEVLSDHPNWSWRIVAAKSSVSRNLELAVVRLEVLKRSRETVPEVLTTVELLVPGKKRATP